MLILACQRCGEIQLLAGSPDERGKASAMWSCPRCGTGQLLELRVSKDARRGDLRKIVGGLALASPKAKKLSIFSRVGMPDEFKS